MAENILLKLRVKSLAMADPITSAAGVATAVWSDLPLTLRDDEISIVEGEPDESEVFSHENDSPEDYDITGKGLSATGSFIKIGYDDLVTLLGGAKVGEVGSEKFHHSTKKTLLNQALKATLVDDSVVIIPNAKGYVNANLNLGRGGVQKFPFKFRCLAGAADWLVDIIW